MEKVFGIYQGCIFEGGGVEGTLYADKDEAVKEAIRVFEEKERINRKLFYRNNNKHYENYKWRKCSKEDNRWHNTVDEIKVVEFEVKPKDSITKQPSKKVIILHRIQNSPETSFWSVDLSKLKVDENNLVEKSFYNKLVELSEKEGDHSYFHWNFESCGVGLEEDFEEFNPQEFYLQNGKDAAMPGDDEMEYVPKVIELIEE